jgi:hypothetical protein
VLEAGWDKIINFCVENKIKHRHRKEGEQVIFTSDLAFLDFIISEGLHKEICYLEYTSEKYETALSNVDMISTGVKLVKKDTKFCYQVTLGHMGWYKNSEIRIALTKYLVDNSELFEARGYHNEILKRFRAQRKEIHISTVYDGFVFYAADPDDILTLHLLAPGKIRKVIKLVKGTAT